MYTNVSTEDSFLIVNNLHTILCVGISFKNYFNRTFIIYSGNELIAKLFNRPQQYYIATSFLHGSNFSLIIQSVAAITEHNDPC